MWVIDVGIKEFLFHVKGIYTSCTHYLVQAHYPKRDLLNCKERKKRFVFSLKKELFHGPYSFWTDISSTLTYPALLRFIYYEENVEILWVHL